jgi:hypothetical protein
MTLLLLARRAQWQSGALGGLTPERAHDDSTNQCADAAGPMPR